jgi:Cu-Zn family superoxide dismutase
MRRGWLKLCLCAIAVGVCGAAEAADRATARMTAPDGADRGTVEFQATPHGVLLRVRLRGLPPGAHGFHIHAVGKCEPPSFDSAGPHYSPRRARHGFLHQAGAHEGDLPNLHASLSGAVELELAADGAMLNDGGLLDADGAAIVVHADADDYTTDPSGNSGARIACGVIRP